MRIFNRRAIKFHRNRAANKIDKHDFIITQIYKLISDRFHNKFDFLLNLGAHTGQLLKLFSQYDKVINSDLSESMLRNTSGINVTLDEEFIPFKSESFDGIISVATLHRINDLPGTLIQIYNILKKEGIFIATLFGPNTLRELKQSVMEKEISPMVYPFIDVKDAGKLMQRAGFYMSVADTENLIIKYKNIEGLFDDLRYTGETNALTQMKKTLITKTKINDIKKRYKKKFVDENGLIPATFEIVTITGMKDVD
ncbi:MAG: methyltransferase domain-containing protein [Rickettsiaceae bacterium H1]|nr:methyltransferase domain-containing protein [Rickettsiaceae bacterium H1]